MTLWNHLNVFSDPRRPAGDKPSASFDPSRTGDPLGPRPGEPAIGIGDTRADGATLAGDPRRHPIGFAPAEERASEPPLPHRDLLQAPSRAAAGECHAGAARRRFAAVVAHPRRCGREVRGVNPRPARRTSRGRGRAGRGRGRRPVLQARDQLPPQAGGARGAAGPGRRSRGRGGCDRGAGRRSGCC